MKTSAVVLLLLLWSAVGPLRSEEAVAVSVRCLDGEAAAVETPALHVFGGAPLAFRVAVDAPLGTRLSLRADLLQTVTGNFFAPMQTGVPVSGELSFETRTHLIAACTLPGLPAVQRPTRMILKLRVVSGDRPEPPSFAMAEVWAYPPENPGEWKKTVATALAQGGLSRLEVFGQGSRLRQFFKERHVDFEDGGAEWFTTADPRTLYIGDEPPPVPARIASLDGLRVLLFQPPGVPALLPGVYQHADSQGGVTVKVTLPDLLAHLPDDPRGQQTLAAVLRLGLAPRSPATANSTPNPDSP